MKIKKAQSFLFSAIVFSLFLFTLTYKISDLAELNKIEYKEDYLISLNYFLNTLEDAYNKHLIDWNVVDCKYRVKVLVLNPGIEEYKFIILKNLTSFKITDITPYLEDFSCNNSILVDQFGRKLRFESFEEDGKCGVKFWDFLNTNEMRYYYIYYSCKNGGSSSSLTGPEDQKSIYYYNIYPIEKKDSFEIMSNNIVSNILAKQNYEFTHSNNYSLKQENFSLQNDWLYHDNLVID
jgi:hypothetical protein